ncbi:MAG: carboxypeptidase-like regulatory domain-containing protein [Burkholderiales bacterium]|nr:carboxypeptidase-like regulatory domain-containing protein [Burkholderiales bacterium]
MALATATLCALAITACVAPRATAPQSAGPVSEPALLGRVIDHQTRQPIAGAFVYGHYASATGKLGGGSQFGELVRSFATQSDAQGYFQLDAWDSGNRTIPGERRGKFPAITIWKPGYEVSMQGLNSIREWYPANRSASTSAKPKVTVNAIDWRDSPTELKPATSEQERYLDLTLSDRAIMFDGECGWETYAPLLRAQHEEWMRWYRAAIPPEHLDANGYPKSSYRYDRIAIWGVSKPTVVDQLTEERARASTNWKCSEPSKYFKKNLE